MKNKRAQAALEYLMTYGWALVIIAIVAAALFAMGIINPATYAQKTCTGFQQLTYSDHIFSLDNNNYAIVIGNGIGSSIAVTDVDVQIKNGPSDNGNVSGLTTLTPGEAGTFSAAFDSVAAAGKKGDP